MKKSKKIGLSLNKKVVSNFKLHDIRGGDTHTCIGYNDCGHGTLHCYGTRGCPTGRNCSPDE